MTAIGIHDRPTRKLGRRPEDRAKPKIALADVLATELPNRPIADGGPLLNFDMDRNDQAGDCVVAGVNHALQVIYNLLGVDYTPWSDDQILAYYQTQNPDFRSWDDAGGPADRGMVIAEFLSYLVKHGVILGFAKVDHRNTEELQTAVYLGLALVSGANMQQAQQTGTLWDYRPDSPDWGGHCTAQDGYDPNYQTISWGSDRYRMTPEFMTKRVDEVYFIITQAHIDHPSFRDGLSLDAFSKAFTAVTGRPWNAKWGPTHPTPEPTPPNGGGASFRLDPDLVARVGQAAAHRGVSPERWLNTHLRHYFR